MKECLEYSRLNVIHMFKVNFNTEKDWLKNSIFRKILRSKIRCYSLVLFCFGIIGIKYKDIS